MKIKLTSLTLSALFVAVGSTGALAHEPPEAGMTHWMEHLSEATQPATGQPRGTQGPVTTESLDTYVPDPAEAGSTDWLGRIGKPAPAQADKPRGKK